MTRIDETRAAGTAEIARKYQELLQRTAQNEAGRLLPSLGSGSQKKLNTEEMKMATACRDFEALFIQQMFSEMRRGLKEDFVLGDEGGLLGADRNRSSFFRDQMYQSLSQDMANQGGFGIGSVLFEQLYRQEYPDPVIEVAAKGGQGGVGLPENREEDIYQVLEQQRQVLQQKQSLTQARLQSRFYQ